MKNILAMLLLFVACLHVNALEIDPFKGPKPLAVLIQTDPWLDVIGSDTPMVAIYDDGQVIYLKREGNKTPVLVRQKITRDELTKIKKKLAAFGDYSKLKRHYDLAPYVTDQPETYIYLNLGGKTFVTSVYGLMVPDTESPADTTSEGKRKADRLPNAIRDLHAYLTSLAFAGAKPWDPPYVEAMIWPYDYAPDESVYWPKDWPGLVSPNTLKRGDSYSIFLPGKELPRLRDFLKTQKEKGAVELDGKKWAVSYRYAFPGEPVWFKAFRGKSEGNKPDKPTKDNGRSPR
jgi:hypothetical protein